MAKGGGAYWNHVVYQMSGLFNCMLLYARSAVVKGCCCKAQWLKKKKGCGFIWTSLKQRGGPAGLTHTDETTGGSGLEEQEVWNCVPLAGKARWKKHWVMTHIIISISWTPSYDRINRNERESKGLESGGEVKGGTRNWWNSERWTDFEWWWWWWWRVWRTHMVQLYAEATAFTYLTRCPLPLCRSLSSVSSHSLPFHLYQHPFPLCSLSQS